MVVLLMGVLGSEILSASAIMKHLEEHPDPDQRFYVSDVGWARPFEPVSGMPPDWTRFKNEIMSWMNDEGVEHGRNYSMTGTTTVSPATINWNDRPFPFWPLKANQVIILTNTQYRRQISQRPQKLDWAKWYVEQEIPVYLMNSDHELIPLNDIADFSYIDQIVNPVTPKKQETDDRYHPQEREAINPFNPNPYDPKGSRKQSGGYWPEDDDPMSKLLDQYRRKMNNPEGYYDSAGANS